MKKTFLTIALAAFAVGAQANIKPCEELKQEMAAKIDAKGVKGYTLTVVDADKVGDAKVVGSCDAGKSKITYEKK